MGPTPDTLMTTPEEDMGFRSTFWVPSKHIDGQIKLMELSPSNKF
jgi:hypothetical protein